MEYSKEEYDIIYVKNKVKYYSQIVEDIEKQKKLIVQCTDDAKWKLCYASMLLNSNVLYGQYFNKYSEYKDVWLENIKNVRDIFTPEFFTHLDNCSKKVRKKQVYWERKLKEMENENSEYSK